MIINVIFIHYFITFQSVKAEKWQLEEMEVVEAFLEEVVFCFKLCPSSLNGKLSGDKKQCLPASL